MVQIDGVPEVAHQSVMVDALLLPISDIEGKAATTLSDMTAVLLHRIEGLHIEVVMTTGVLSVMTHGDLQGETGKTIKNVHTTSRSLCWR